MKSFKDYHENKLDEVSLSSIISLAKNKIKSLFTSLGFGKKVTIKIPVGIIAEETIDTKSRLGYLSEYATAAHLADEIKANGGRIDQSLITHLHQEYKNKKADLEKIHLDDKEKQNLHKEIVRMETAGQVMAKQIFNDIVVGGEDFNTLTFHIELTGDSAKGVSKADLVLTVSKDSEKQIVDRINASLKAYKSSAINLSNSTFISLIKTIFYDSDSNLPKTTPEFIVKFAKDYGSGQELEKLFAHQNIIGTLMKQGSSKEDARKQAKLSHGEVIELISKIFRTYYPKHKKEINERVLKMMGFDGDDDFYAAIGDSGKQKVISSRKSKELQSMLQKLSGDFNLTVERNGTTNNANIMFKSPSGEVITKANITFADTGGKSAQGKTNAFVDFKGFM